MNFHNEIHVLLPSYQLWQQEFHNNVNVGDKFLQQLLTVTLGKVRHYSLQYKEFHFIPPALVVSEISTHSEISSLKGFVYILYAVICS